MFGGRQQFGFVHAERVDERHISFEPYSERILSLEPSVFFRPTQKRFSSDRREALFVRGEGRRVPRSSSKSIAKFLQGRSGSEPSDAHDRQRLRGQLGS